MQFFVFFHLIKNGSWIDDSHYLIFRILSLKSHFLWYFFMILNDFYLFVQSIPLCKCYLWYSKEGFRISRIYPKHRYKSWWFFFFLTKFFFFLTKTFSFWWKSFLFDDRFFFLTIFFSFWRQIFLFDDFLFFLTTDFSFCHHHISKKRQEKHWWCPYEVCGGRGTIIRKTSRDMVLLYPNSLEFSFCVHWGRK